MRPLTIDDLLPLQEYAERRREFFDAHLQYLDRYRRVRVGPIVTLLFQNRQTLWFTIQEVIRVARLVEAEYLQAELDLYNRLLPGRDTLQAALILSTPDPDDWSDVAGQDIQLRIGDIRAPAQLVTCRPEDRCDHAAQWVQFPISAEARRGLEDSARPLFFEVCHREYRHLSPALSDDVRQSLLDDLRMSDDYARALRRAS